MAGHIFNIQDDGKLVEMNEEPFSSEDDFQCLLAKYPNLLAGEQMQSDSPRRWLLIKREMGIPSEDAGGGRWSLDHLFLDQDAVPTLVEVKRSSDTRIRREVVGQMMDYAANAVVYWPIEKMQAEYEQNCHAAGVDPRQRLEDFVGKDADLDEFWRKAKTNLQAKRIRMLFVADVIPSELRRIVEFLNELMDPAEVLAVEIRHYVGQGMKTLVPRVIGLTAEAEQRKRVTSEGRQWDEVSFLQELAAQRNAEEAGVAEAILDWAKRTRHSIRWGKGKTVGQAMLWFRQGGKDCRVVGLSTSGVLDIGFGGIGYKIPTIDVPAKTAELQHSLEQDFGVRATPGTYSEFLIPFAHVVGKESRLISLLEWAEEQVRSA
ncbi:MAG: hypothetical protein HUU20_01550 [Pirellulales bacterium]|nr:hypothetical protein [Pirellulales bacterium]